MRHAGTCDVAPAYQQALAVFSGQTDLPWLRLFRAGFRHCFVAISDGAAWIVIDPLSHRTEVTLLPVPANFDLAAYYESQGLTVVAVEPRAVRRRPAPFAPHNCVEAVKRVLGIHARWIVSPFQLYRFLTLASNDHRAAPDQAQEYKKKYPILYLTPQATIPRYKPSTGIDGHVSTQRTTLSGQAQG